MGEAETWGLTALGPCFALSDRCTAQRGSVPRVGTLLLEVSWSSPDTRALPAGTQKPGPGCLVGTEVLAGLERSANEVIGADRIVE